MIWLLGAVGVVVVVALVVLLVVRPWQESAGTGDSNAATFELDSGIGVTFTVPAGWQARAFSSPRNKYKRVMLVPNGDSRTPEQIDSAYGDLRSDGTGTAIHVIVFYADTALSNGDEWEMNSLQTSTEGKAIKLERKMWLAVAHGMDVEVEALDMDVSAPESLATDLLVELSKGQTVTTSYDSTRKTARPSS